MPGENRACSACGSAVYGQPRPCARCGALVCGVCREPANCAHCAAEVLNEVLAGRRVRGSAAARKMLMILAADDGDAVIERTVVRRQFPGARKEHRYYVAPAPAAVRQLLDRLGVSRLDGPLAWPAALVATPWTPPPPRCREDAPPIACPHCNAGSARFREIETALVCAACGRSFTPPV